MLLQQCFLGFKVLVKIRAEVFYQDLKSRAEGDIFKSDKHEPRVF